MNVWFFFLIPSSFFAVTLTIVYQTHTFITRYMVCHFSLLPLIMNIQKYNHFFLLCYLLYCTTLYDILVELLIHLIFELLINIYIYVKESCQMHMQLPK